MTMRIIKDTMRNGGPRGPSAYAIAVANGFVGTEAEWLASLVGPPGPPGPPDLLDDILGDGLAFAVVDEAGRRTWIEAAADGGLTDRAVSKIGEHIAGTEAQDTAITGIAFAVVDEDGRRTELEVGEDGRFTDRVIASIGERLSITPVDDPDPATVILPSGVPLLASETYQLWYDAIVAALSADHDVLLGRAGNLGDHWETTPGGATSYTLTLTVADRTGATVTSGSTPVTVYAVPDATGRRHLAIGDSITQDGTYVADAVAALPGMDTVGIRTFDDGAFNREGRGGWTLERYHTFTLANTYGESPFLFPQGIAGSAYWGTTGFWRNVCYDDPSGSWYAGFQHIARGWQPAPAPYLYDASGYPVSPTTGDVVYDSDLAAFRQYDGSAWVTMATQPAVEFSFTKYMERFAAAFPSGGPTSVSIMLETNDFFASQTETEVNDWLTRMDTTIASIRAWDADVPVILLLAPVGGPWANWGPMTVNKAEFDRRMRAMAETILATYDTPAQRTNAIYVATFLGAVDPANMRDHVHPEEASGHPQMAPWLAGMLAKLINEGAM